MSEVQKESYVDEAKRRIAHLSYKLEEAEKKIKTLEYDNAELIVLSKWGAKVFITTSREVHWDGKSNDGAELPAGVYYYVLKLNDGEKEQNGTITLLR